ncbi:MAG: glucosamine-6-phosphate deaminase [Limisphaerales bacterium]
MEVIIRPDAESAAGLVADFVAKELVARPSLVLGLATGCTMESVYDHLVWLHVEKGLDFSRCRTFNLDEYIGLPADNPHSYHDFMKRRLFSKVNIDLRNTHLPNGMAADFDAECANFEKLIVQNGGIDLQLLGIGLNGHLGFNEPLSTFDSRTRVQTLSQTTRLQNAPLFPSPELTPQQAITMGIGTILEARRCLLLATGKEKADIVAKAIEGPITTMITATALQSHPACTVVLDEDAAAGLKKFDRWRENHSQRSAQKTSRSALYARDETSGGLAPATQ